MAFQKYSHMDQSLFTRFVRLGIPYIELNAQGRARPSVAKLYNWRYRDLGDLPFVRETAAFHKANAGFSYEYQLVDVPDYHGRGESAPSPWFYQNEGEAEYIVSVYMYMRLLGYPASKISILTTYNGQKLLIRDVINRRCMACGLGPPSKVATVDKFQGQQNDFILLSLVRTRFVGHLRDVRRLVVAMSRARLGLYVFCRRSLFEQCYELQPTFQILLQRPDHLALNLDETTSYTERLVGDTGKIYFIGGIQEMDNLVNSKLYHQLYQAQFNVYNQPPAQLDAVPGALGEYEEQNKPENLLAGPNTIDVHLSHANDDNGNVLEAVPGAMEEHEGQNKTENLQDGPSASDVDPPHVNGAMEEHEEQNKTQNLQDGPSASDVDPPHVNAAMEEQEEPNKSENLQDGPSASNVDPPHVNGENTNMPSADLSSTEGETKMEE